jgi:hypothetical protein
MGSLVLHERALKNARLQVAVKVLGVEDVHFSPAEQPREILRDVNNLPSGNVPGLKLDQHVDVACRAEVVAQHRSKER